MPKSKILLNEKQKKAVVHKAGPLLVVAGAGTGKTRVITERIRHLIQKEGVSPNEILALTFTDKASQEMMERLDDAMPLGYEEPWLYTFHAFADRLLREEGLEIGLDSSYKIISYPEQWLLLRTHLYDLGLDYFKPLGNPTKFISAILTFISRLKDENITQEVLENFAKSFEGELDEKKRWVELSNVFNKYSEIKLKESKMDFGDLITWSIRLFSERPNILKQYQTQFKHVLVDEFQDTNHAQYELIKMLCPPDQLTERSLLVVGDDSQSIYKFRGAAISNILEFQKDYPFSKMETLLENYRSNQAILDAAYSLIKHNDPDTLEVKLGISKELISMKEESPLIPIAIQTPTLEDEVEFVVQKIIEIMGKEPSYNYRDFAILARANSHLDPFVNALRQYGLPYQLVGNKGLYDRDEIRDIMSLLKVIVNPLDSISLFRVLSIDVFGLKSDLISKLLAEAKVKKIDLWESVLNCENEELHTLVNVIRSFQKDLTDKTPTEFVYDLVHTTGYLQRFIVEDSTENQLSINNLNLFLTRVKRFEASYKADIKSLPTVVDLLEFLELMIDAGENPAQAEIEDIQTINLLTVHSSKGLEFPVVFIVNLVSDRFPTRNRRDPIQIPEELIKEILPTGDPHIQEERRLFYVGLTRAQKYLYMTSAVNYGGKRDKKLSGYIEETNIKVTTDFGANILTQESLFGVNSLYRTLDRNEFKNRPLNSLSYSKISDYKSCPLMYKYKHVINIPTPQNHALSFGNTIHNTLKDFDTKKLVGETPQLKDLLEIYKNNWNAEGFMDARHREAYFENGEKLLKAYWDLNKDSNVKPVAIEKSFNMKIGGIKISGRIDRIDPLPSGGVEIIDYKTGTTKTQKEIDKDDQVTLYSLAAQNALGLDPKKLTYYYLDSGEKISTKRTPEQLDAAVEDIENVIEKIKSGDFEPTPGMHCTWCDFNTICPYAYKS